MCVSLQRSTVYPPVVLPLDLAQAPFLVALHVPVCVSAHLTFHICVSLAFYGIPTGGATAGPGPDPGGTALGQGGAGGVWTCGRSDQQRWHQL